MEPGHILEVHSKASSNQRVATTSRKCSQSTHTVPPVGTPGCSLRATRLTFTLPQAYEATQWTGKRLIVSASSNPCPLCTDIAGARTDLCGMVSRHAVADGLGSNEVELSLHRPRDLQRTHRSARTIGSLPFVPRHRITPRRGVQNGASKAVRLARARISRCHHRCLGSNEYTSAMSNSWTRSA